MTVGHGIVYATVTVYGFGPADYLWDLLGSLNEPKLETKVPPPNVRRPKSATEHGFNSRYQTKRW